MIPSTWKHLYHIYTTFDEYYPAGLSNALNKFSHTQEGRELINKAGGVPVFIFNKATQEIEGVYNSSQYAINRARYKFKRLMSKVDKTILG